MMLMSIDSSSRKSGWAIFNCDEYATSGLINLDTAEYKKKFKNNSFERAKYMASKILEIASEYKPDIIVIEKPAATQNVATIRMLCEIVGSVLGYSLLSHCFYYEMFPAEWRKQLKMQGKHKKDEYKRMSKEYVKNKYDKDVSDDEADAICLGSAYIIMMDKKEKK